MLLGGDGAVAERQRLPSGAHPDLTSPGLGPGSTFASLKVLPGGPGAGRRSSLEVARATRVSARLHWHHTKIGCRSQDTLRAGNLRSAWLHSFQLPGTGKAALLVNGRANVPSSQILVLEKAPGNPENPAEARLGMWHCLLGIPEPCVNSADKSRTSDIQL